MKTIKSMLELDNTGLTFVKLIIVLLIVITTFVDVSKYIRYFDTYLFKVIAVVVIIIACYWDLHIGILLLIAFMVMVVQANAMSVKNIDAKRLELFLSSMHANVEIEETPHLDTKVECDNESKNKSDNDIFAYSVDTKIKPYEVFVKMLTTQEHLENASNSAFLS